MKLPEQPEIGYPKAYQCRGVKIKHTQRQLGNISNRVRMEVRKRSGGICEIRQRCGGAQATEQAHLRGRRRMEWKTTAADLRDACTACHDWLDKTGEGVKHRKLLLKGG